MKKIIFYIIIIFILTGVQGLHVIGSLDDFKSGTEKSGSKSGGGGSGSTGNSGGGFTSSDDSDCSCLTPVVNFIIGSWFYHNLSIVY